MIPLTTDRATALAASSYTCFVLHSPPKTLSIIWRAQQEKINEQKKINIKTKEIGNTKVTSNAAIMQMKITLPVKHKTQLKREKCKKSQQTS